MNWTPFDSTNPVRSKHVLRFLLCSPIGIPFIHITAFNAQLPPQAHLNTCHHIFLQYLIEEQQAEQWKHWYGTGYGSKLVVRGFVVIGEKKSHLFNFKPYFHFQKSSIKGTSIDSCVNLLLLNLWMTLQWPFSYLIITVSLSYLCCPSAWISMPS